MPFFSFFLLYEILRKLTYLRNSSVTHLKSHVNKNNKENEETLTGAVRKVWITILSLFQCNK